MLKMTIPAPQTIAQEISRKVVDLLDQSDKFLTSDMRVTKLLHEAGNTLTRRVCRIAYERHLLPKKAAPKAPSQQRRAASSGSHIDL